MRIAKIIKDGQVVTGLEQLDTGMRSNISGTARHENHIFSPVELSSRIRLKLD